MKHNLYELAKSILDLIKTSPQFKPYIDGADLNPAVNENKFGECTRFDMIKYHPDNKRTRTRYSVTITSKDESY